MKSSHHNIISIAAACILTLLSANKVQAQATTYPEENKPANVPSVVPVPVTNFPGLADNPFYNTALRNFVRIYEPGIPVVASTNVPAANARMTTNYVDGLGRPWQEIIAGGADNLTKDLVKIHTYDEFGRESYSYVPFAHLGNGKLVTDPLATIQQSHFPASGQQPYSFIRYENSPLGRVTETQLPGSSWVGSNRGATMEYRTNSIMNEDVRIWTIGNNSGDVPISTAAYADGALSVTVANSEDDNQTIEYKDKNGHVILSKKALYDCHSAAHCGFACTYYVYNDIGQLRYVIPPLAVEGANTGSTWTINNVANLCYSYFYDDKGRVIEKHIPDKGIESYVYDARNRLVMSQDAKQKNNERWSFSIYDQLNRPVASGLYMNNQDRTTLQAQMDNTSLYFQAGTLFSYLRNYNLYQPDISSVTSAEILGRTYYDTYNYPSTPFAGVVFDGSMNSQLTGAAPVAEIPVPSAELKGMITATMSRIVNADGTYGDWLTSVNFYDYKNRLIQQKNSNLNTGWDVITNQYSFRGELLCSIQQINNPSTSIPSQQQLTVIKRYVIAPNTGAEQAVFQRINGGQEMRIHSYNWSVDYPGKIYRKMMASFEEDYTYNVNGWLTGINPNYVDNGNYNQDLGPFFGEQICYDNGFGSKLYNGNIAGIVWRNAAGSAKQSYGYSYDRLNRLKHAEYGKWEMPQPGSPEDWTKVNTDFTASGISYDINGNLQTMNQRGPVYNAPNSLAPGDMDKLVYNYFPASNQLMGVTETSTDAPSATPDFRDNGSTGPQDYQYDENGNLKQDQNKGINWDITYSTLNKPLHIQSVNNGSVDFTYDAAGNKLRKVVTPISGTPETWDYIGNAVYKNNELQYVLNEEGRCRPIVSASGATSFEYDYFFKDHLGNVRTVVNAQVGNVGTYTSPNNPGTTTIASAYAKQYKSGMEIASANIESMVWDNLNDVRDDKPGSTDPQDTKAALMNASYPEKRIGPAMMLRVMPGDQFEIASQTYYDAIGNDQSVGEEDIISSLLTSLSGGVTHVGISVSELPENADVVNGCLNNGNVVDVFKNLVSQNSDHTLPASYLAYIVFNEKMEVVPDQSGVLQMGGAGGQWNALGTNGAISIKQPGYVAIFSATKVMSPTYIDNLIVTFYKGKVLEENHYFPFGLTLTSSTNNPMEDNKYKLTTKELQSDLNLNWYDFGARMQDEQIGRWTKIDPKVESFYDLSGYTYVANNPASFVDPDGEFSLRFSGDFLVQNGVTDIAGFTKYAMSQMDKLEQFGNDNPDVIMGLSRITGLSTNEIKRNFKSGDGPSFVLGSIGWLEGEKQNPNDKTIDIDGRPLIAQFNAYKSGNDEEEYYQGVANITYMLHEYGHYGDKKTNGGVNSGQKGIRDPGDLSESSDPTGWQNKVAITGHRGRDVDHILLFGEIRYDSHSGYVNPAYWDGISTRINDEFKNLIKKSARFGPYTPRH